jgi:hypothetical protein
MDKFRKWLSVKEAKKLGLKEKPNTEGEVNQGTVLQKNNFKVS